MKNYPALLACFAVTLLFVTNSEAVAGDWPQFRGPGGLGVSEERNLPVEWSDTENLAWRTALPGYGASSPITLGGKVYVTCYSGYGTGGESQSMEDLTLHVVCVNRNDGSIAWDKNVKPKLPESERVRDHGYAGPTPATDGEFLYVFFGKTGVFKFDLNGKQIWQADVGSKTHGWGCGTSPVLFENLVIVNASVESGSLIAIDKASGNEVWRAGGMQSSWNTPHLVQLANGQQELVVSVQGNILGFDPKTGNELWRCDGIPDYVCPSVISQQGIAYVIGGRTSRAIAVRAGGRGDVTDTHRLWEAKAGANVASPVILDGHMYWVSDRNQIAYCVRLSDGDVLYSERFRGQPYASATAGDGKIYIVTRNGGTYVLAATPEFTQLAHNKFDDNSTFNASPVISNGQIFLRSDRFLYCVGNARGVAGF
ncbi:MAG: PQQ-binding-like beta-propeller repeat protein [Planctomycetota bacterium]|nr:PQQ-binding-like beta-propeller repeat protein [Planctomycetota bacterium]